MLEISESQHHQIMSMTLPRLMQYQEGQLIRAGIALSLRHPFDQPCWQRPTMLDLHRP